MAFEDDAGDAEGRNQNTSSLEIELITETAGIDDTISEGEGDVRLEDRVDAVVRTQTVIFDNNLF